MTFSAPPLTSTPEKYLNDVSIEIISPLRKRAEAIQIGTPEKHFNDASVEIISPPRKRAETIQMRATLKSSKDCASKGYIIKKLHRKYME